MPFGKFPGPYFTCEDVLQHNLADFIGGDDPLRDETATHVSFSSEYLLHLVVRANLKQTCKSIWPQISKLILKRYEPQEPWEFATVYSERGMEYLVQPPAAKLWSELVNEACESEGSDVPQVLRDHIYVLLLFIILFPYRATPSAIRFLGARLSHVWMVTPG
jgi:hypothetical protein